MKDTQHLQLFESNLSQILAAQCQQRGFIGDSMFEIEELDSKWAELAPEYMVDAIPLVNEYPSVSMAWAAYLGMGLANIWDTDWQSYAQKSDLYSTICSSRGFDEMDEYITEEILALTPNSAECNAIEDLLRSCTQTAMSLIKKESYEPQSADAFYVFASTAKVFYRLGVSIELKRLGYKYEKVTVEVPKQPDCVN